MPCAKSTVFFFFWQVNGTGSGLPTAMPWGVHTMKRNPVMFSVFISHKSQPCQNVPNRGVPLLFQGVACRASGVRFCHLHVFCFHPHCTPNQSFWLTAFSPLDGQPSRKSPHYYQYNESKLALKGQTLLTALCGDTVFLRPSY